MNKIKCIVKKETAYVFHMLSVAKCGYDNQYGEKYRDRHNTDDLKLLKDNEKLITVKGGEYCGELYETIVCNAASSNDSINDYYEGIIRNIEKYEEKHRNVLLKISEVMIRNYDIYSEIWDANIAEIQDMANNVEREFDKNQFSEQAEKLLSTNLQEDAFKAVLVNSIANGAEAIDISPEMDVFGTGRSVEDEVIFIAHEFIIYLLLNSIEKELIFEEFENWSKFEGLAEFYMIKILGTSKFFDEQLKYVKFYEDEYEKNSQLTAKELYLKAVENF